VLMLVIFSISKFQLPFYTNILFPFFSIITAAFIKQLMPGGELRFFKISQFTVCALLVLAVVGLNFVFAPQKWLTFVLLMAGSALLVIYIYRKRCLIYERIFLLTGATSILVNFYLVLVAYPTIVSYKGDVMAAKYLNSVPQHVPVTVTFMSNSFNFYIKEPVKYSSLDSVLRDKPNSQLLLTDESGLNRLKKAELTSDTIRVFDNYPRETLALPFILTWKRSTTLNHFYLVRVR